MSKWLKFLRHYGPVPRNDNMYDETIHRSARRQGIVPINFTHPYQDQVIQCFSQNMMTPVSVILTGTAGDGKTHLCRQVWNLLKGEDDKWVSDNPYLTLRYHLTSSGSDAQNLKRAITVHFIRDLSGWARNGNRKRSNCFSDSATRCLIRILTRYSSLQPMTGSSLSPFGA